MASISLHSLVEVGGAAFDYLQRTFHINGNMAPANLTGKIGHLSDSGDVFISAMTGTAEGLVIQVEAKRLTAFFTG